MIDKYFDLPIVVVIDNEALHKNMIVRHNEWGDAGGIILWMGDLPSPEFKFGTLVDWDEEDKIEFHGTFEQACAKAAAWAKGKGRINGRNELA